MSISLHSKRHKAEYFAALDGFRGVLALMIAIYHTMWLSHINSSDFFTNGPVLVDMFFVFSGFLMFRLYDDALSTIPQARRFIWRRFARIYPLHFFMLLIALTYAFARLLAHWFGFATYTPGEILPFQPGATETLGSFLANLTLTQSMGLFDHLSYNMPSWTVSVEFWAYFVFAGMMLWARPSKLWHFAIIAGLIALNYYGLSRIKPNIDFHYDFGFWRCIGGFFTGVLVAYTFRFTKAIGEKLHRKNIALSTGVEIFSLMLMIGFVIYCPGKLQFFIAPVAFVFVLTFAHDAGLVSKFMGTRLMRYLAKISYSVYMVHILVSLFFSIFAEILLPKIFGPLWNATQISGDLLLIPYLICVLIFSHLTYHYIEMPGRKAILASDPGRLFRVFKSVKT